jgi:hypothetical protein
VLFLVSSFSFFQLDREKIYKKGRRFIVNVNKLAPIGARQTKNEKKNRFLFLVFDAPFGLPSVTKNSFLTGEPST